MIIKRCFFDKVQGPTIFWGLQVFQRSNATFPALKSSDLNALLSNQKCAKPHYGNLRYLKKTPQIIVHFAKGGKRKKEAGEMDGLEGEGGRSTEPKLSKDPQVLATPLFANP